MTLTNSEEAHILSIERPHSNLMVYYFLVSIVIPPLFPVLIIYHSIRYRTLRYRFTDEGISMRWGMLFRREVIIQYARIQDIHLRTNAVERWLGLAKILVQTASGSSSAEMTLEGLQEFEAVRDFLYNRMRGVKDPVVAGGKESNTGGAPAHTDELAGLLREITTEVKGLRTELSARKGQS